MKSIETGVTDHWVVINKENDHFPGLIFIRKSLKTIEEKDELKPKVPSCKLLVVVVMVGT